LTVTHDGREVTLLTPASALYRKLVGLRVGDMLREPSMMVAGIA
jgi:hypothetical protein